MCEPTKPGTCKCKGPRLVCACNICQKCGRDIGQLKKPKKTQRENK